MKQLSFFLILLTSALIFNACNSSNPQLQRNVAFEMCSCMGTKDALLIRDTLAMNEEIRMLHYTQCIFEYGQKIDPFEASFRKMIQATCADLVPLHDAFVKAGTKK